MRVLWLVVALTSTVAVACAHGAIDGDDPNLAVDDSTSIPPEKGGGARLPPGGEPSSSSSGSPTTDAGVDASSTPPTDAGSETSTPVLACPTPIDVSVSGSYPIDTCALKKNVGATCAAGGIAPGVAVKAASPSTGSTYLLTLPADWVIQQSDVTCGGMAFSCGPASWGVSGWTGQPNWYFLLARADGTCGTATLVVNRTQ